MTLIYLLLIRHSLQAFEMLVRVVYLAVFLPGTCILLLLACCLALNVTVTIVVVCGIAFM